MTNLYYLGLDAGGSGTKWVLISEQTLAEGYAPPLTTATLDTAAGAHALATLVEQLPARPAAIHVGMPGLSAGSTRATEVAQRLGQVFGIASAKIEVEGDLDLAYRAHLPPGQGILVYAGTGSIAYAMAEGGRVTRVGGRGYRIGDEGGGASIGRAALRWATDFLDMGQQPHGRLAEHLAHEMGGLDWDTMRQFVYGTPGASSLARLAPAVTRAAKESDKDAQQMLEAAAHSLAELAGRMRQQLGPLPVVATGGALRSLPLQEALRRNLPDVTIQFRNHAEVAAQLARELA